MPGWTRYEPSDRTHMVEHHIHVKPGETLTGDHFPTVMEGGILSPAQAPTLPSEGRVGEKGQGTS